MIKRRSGLFTLGLMGCIVSSASSPIDSLAYRVTGGESRGKIEFCESPGGKDYFLIEPHDGGKVKITGNNAISMAAGLNRYLTYRPTETVRMDSDMPLRYYLNYCTYSYSMPFWDEARWDKEIDWMALHGINMPLSLTGTEVVWRNVLRRLGYPDEAIKKFIPGPAYMAWWMMNNLEGWGGPLPDSWFDRQEALQKHVVARMRSLGMEPVLPGYAGMVPRDISERLGVDIADPGLWCGFPRPAFLSPSDPRFNEIADIYYDELEKLYGKSRYYSIDPFHEGGSAKGVDLGEAAKSILAAMKRANPDGVWVIQSWQENPRKPIVDAIAAGDMIVLDLYSEKVPKWRRDGIYGDHDWIYCMLLNFGGNIGLHGRMDALVNGYYDAKADSLGRRLVGVGATPEGIENNPVMYDLVFDLPWIKDRFSTADWLRHYLEGRYGRVPEPELVEAWETLRATVYNAPVEYPGQGTVESVLCARPSRHVGSASTWGNSELFYSPDSTQKAANLMKLVACNYDGNANFKYDYVDVQRQANADRANLLSSCYGDAMDRGDTLSARKYADEFLSLILSQDSLLSTVKGMRVDDWIDAAAAAGTTPEEKKLYKRNAAMLITVWGDSTACNRGGLHDYSHREWSGILKELYYKRWKAFFDHELNGAPQPDFYLMECDWVNSRSGE